jgi:hypothetical protein
MDLKVVSISLCRVDRVRVALTESSRSCKSADSWSNLVFRVSKIGCVYGLIPLHRCDRSSGVRASRNIDGNEACHSRAS